MHPIFSIASSDISALNDTQARKLVALLCKAELQSKGRGTDPVTWGGDQRAVDGGVDVRVKVEPGIGISGYIPKDATIYQVKAEPFGKQKILGEMAPKGILRHAISDIAEKSGAYIIVSTRDDLSDLSILKRKRAMMECVAEHGLKGKIHLDFYDSRKLACWVENFPSIVIWVRRELGKSIDGWQPYGHWAYCEESEDSEYFLDDKVKIFTPNSADGINVIQAINQLRCELGKDGTSARIVGLSGVGKTRFVQALFDGRVVTSTDGLNQENVLYADISDNPFPQPSAMLEALHMNGADCIVVIDNCGQDVHQRITEVVKRTGSKIRVITIEYDIREDIPEGTECYRLEGASDEVISKLLNRRYENLSDLDVNRIVEFSDGNARVAFALASTSQKKGELVQLNDELLFNRLFLQRNSENNELQICAEVASLLYSFDAEDISENSELAVLSSICDISIIAFSRNIVELKRRGLVQERGQWRAVLPHAISNRLAFRAVQSNHTSILIKKFVTESSGRVARSFSRRLGYLHESKYAQKISSEWLKPDGLLGDVESLDEVKREMLENISPLNQRAALNALLRAVESKNFISVSNAGRVHFAGLLRSLAYEQDLFEDATDALFKFALEESDDYELDSIRNIIQSLFYSRLSGTQASPEQRAECVRKLVVSGNVAKQKLALLLLRAGFELDNSRTYYSFDFGGLRRSYGRCQKTCEEIREWYSLFIHVTVELGKNVTFIGLDARKILADAFSKLWGDTLINDALTSAARKFAAVDGWPEGWIGMRNTLYEKKHHLDKASFDGLEVLVNELAPRDLFGQIKVNVLCERIFDGDPDDGEAEEAWFCKVQEEAEELGRAAAFDEKVLADLSQYVSHNELANKIFHFGIGIGQASPSVQDILGQIRILIEKAPTGTLDPQFMVGLLVGWNRNKPEDVSDFLDKALIDDVWGAWIVNFQLSIDLDYVGYCRLIKSINIGKVPSLRYTLLCHNQRSDALPVEQMVVLLDVLGKQQNGGVNAVIEILYRLIYCARTKSVEYLVEMRSYCRKTIGEINWTSFDFSSQNFVTHLRKVIEYALAGGAQREVASNALNNLIQQVRFSNRVFQHRIGDFLIPFFKEYSTEALDAIYSNNIDEMHCVMQMLNVQLNGRGQTVVAIVSDEELISWCKISPGDRCIFAAQTCDVFERSKSNGGGGEDIIGISNAAKSVLILATDKRKILDILARRVLPNPLFGSFVGSFVAIMRKRIQLLNQFNPVADVEISALIQEIIGNFSREVESAAHRKKGRERSETASFE